jgi:hypothetical protein
MSPPEKKEDSPRFLSFLRPRRRKPQRVEVEQPPPKPKATPRSSKKAVWYAMHRREMAIAESQAARQLFLEDDLREFCVSCVSGLPIRLF